jgi:hypothetical protein
MTLVLTSGWGGFNWLNNNGDNVKDDFRISKQGVYLNEIADEKAVIATVWAGAPAYYSKRAMIDLLGKSDRKIASRKPVGDINPGHNKWDYNYSIGSLRPDVVFQLWHTIDSDKAKLIQWGYVEKCYLNERMGYFLTQSKSIRWPLLSECRD